MKNYAEKIHAANEMIERLTEDLPPKDFETRRLIMKMAWYACVCGWLTEDEARWHRDYFRLLRFRNMLFGKPVLKGYDYCRLFIYLPKKARGEIKLPEFMQA